MRYCSGVLVWTSIIAFLLSLGALTFLQWQKWNAIQLTDLYLSGDPDTLDSYKIQTGVLAFCAAITFIMLIVVLCSYKKIKLVIAILKTAAVFMGDTPLILILPPVFAIITLLFWLFWMFAITYLYASGTIVAGTNPFASIVLSDKEKYFVLYFIFGGLWKNCFF